MKKLGREVGGSVQTRECHIKGWVVVVAMLRVGVV